MNILKKQIAMIGLALSISGFANAGLITTSADTHLTGATFITFEDEIATTSFTTYNGTGFSITSEGINAFHKYSGYTNYGTYGIGTTGPNFNIMFDSSVSAFSIEAGAVNQNPVIISLFDSNDILIETLSAAGACCSPILYGAFGSDIKRVNFNIDYVIIDGLSFVESAANVPEPTSLAIFGLGLAGIGFMRKRK